MCSAALVGTPLRGIRVRVMRQTAIRGRLGEPSLPPSKISVLLQLRCIRIPANRTPFSGLQKLFCRNLPSGFILTKNPRLAERAIPTTFDAKHDVAVHGVDLVPRPRAVPAASEEAPARR